MKVLKKKRQMPQVHTLYKEVRPIWVPGLGMGSRMASSRPAWSLGYQTIHLSLMLVGKVPNMNITFLWHVTVYIVGSHPLPHVIGSYEFLEFLGDLEPF